MGALSFPTVLSRPPTLCFSSSLSSSIFVSLSLFPSSWYHLHCWVQPHRRALGHRGQRRPSGHLSEGTWGTHTHTHTHTEQHLHSYTHTVYTIFHYSSESSDENTVFPFSYSLNWLINSWCSCCVRVYCFSCAESLPCCFLTWRRWQTLAQALQCCVALCLNKYMWASARFSPHIFHFTPLSFHRARLSHSPRESIMSTAPFRAMSLSLTTLRVWRSRRRSIRSDGCLSRTLHTSSSPPMVRLSTNKHAS